MSKTPVGGRSLGAESENANSSVLSRLDLRTYINDNPDLRPQFLHYFSKLWLKHSMVRLNLVTGLSIDDENVSLPGMYIRLNTETKVLVGKSEEAPKDISTDWAPSHESHLAQRILFESNHLSKFREPILRSVTVVEMMEYYSRFVLVGAPGSGKSTFLQYLTLCMAGEILQRKEANLNTLNSLDVNLAPNPWPHGVLLPVHVELRSFVSSDSFPRNNSKGVAKHLLDYIHSTLLPGRDPDVRTYIQKEDGSVLLMLDGLDEIQEVNESRDRLSEIISDFAESYPACRLIITSRPYAYREGSWRLYHAGFKEAAIADLDKPQIKDFVFRWYQSLNESGQVRAEIIDERVARLTNSIDKHSYLNSLVVTPLLLTMVVTLGQRSGGVLPIDRADLYEESVKLLFDRWNAQKGFVVPVLTTDLGIGIDTLRGKLEEIAFEIHRDAGKNDNAGEISSQQLHKAFMTIPNILKETVDQIMDYLHQKSGIVVADSPKHFRFVHRSFQEYLAACYLLGRVDYPDFLAQLALENPILWREVLLFAARRAATYRQRDVWDLVTKLCPYSISAEAIQENEWQGAYLAGIVILETKLYEQEFLQSYHPVLEHILASLVSCLDSKNISLSERYEIGCILGYVGDPRRGIGTNDNNVPDIEWIEIPKGTFLIGSSPKDEEAFANERPQHEIRLDTYYISKYPITVSQFQSYMKSVENPSRQGDYFQPSPHDDPETYLNNFPIIGVDFKEAISFCEWLGKKLGNEVRLPTQEEWEKAARGEHGRIFPWGDEFEGDRCNANNNIGKLCSVGLFPNGASPYGVMDMCGNIWEWTSSIWQADPGTRKDVGKFHEIRGGAFSSKPAAARCAYHGHEATSQASNQGFRIVASFKKQ